MIRDSRFSLENVGPTVIQRLSVDSRIKNHQLSYVSHAFAHSPISVNQSVSQSVILSVSDTALAHDTVPATALSLPSQLYLQYVLRTLAARVELRRSRDESSCAERALAERIHEGAQQVDEDDQ